MNWEFGTNPTKEMESMIHVCLENKITTFDRMPIFTVDTLPVRLEETYLLNNGD
jgi:hypothetical protein